VLGRLWTVLLGLVGLALLMPGLARAGMTLDPAVPSVDVWPVVRHLEEPEDRVWTATEALARLPEFRDHHGWQSNYGVRRTALWLHVPVDVSPGQDGRWILTANYASLDRIDLHVMDAQGRVERHVVMGDHLRADQRPLPSSRHAVSLVLRPGERYDLMLRVQTTSSFIVPLRLQREAAFQAEESGLQMLQGLLAGISLCLLLYSLAQWFVLRDRMFLEYAVTVGATAAFFLGYFGTGAQHLWGGSEWLTRNAAPLAVLLALGAGSLFIQRALKVGEMHRGAGVGLHVVAVAGFGFAAAFLAGLIDYRQAHLAGTVIGPLPMLLAVPVAWVRMRRGDRAASYMFLAWGLYSISVFVMAALLRGHAPATFWTLHAFQFGSLVEMSLWQMVLGVRMDEIRRAADAARRERDALQSLAHTDALTGLVNRRGLQVALQPMLDAAGPQSPVALYLLDLDGFKPVNDTHGHDVGDELLIGVGHRLRSQVRGSDVVARLGGDEFVVVVAGLNGDADAMQVGLKLLRSFDAPFVVSGITCRVGLTVGYALAPQDGRDAPTLLKRADAAMYAGKQAGRNRVQRGGSAAIALG
jgi:diguanylate cyclase (GGDEF)-like protein